MKDIREQLDNGSEVDLEGQPVNLLVGLLKVISHTCSIDTVIVDATAAKQVLILLLSFVHSPSLVLVFSEGASWQPAQV